MAPLRFRMNLSDTAAATAGFKSGSISFGFNSNGAGTSGLDVLSLGSQVGESQRLRVPSGDTVACLQHDSIWRGS
jgi:hypothetical protein